MPQVHHLLLASRSPRRAQLLDQIGVRYRQVDVDIDETPIRNEAPEAFVRRLALAKAHAGLSADAPVSALGADTAVVVGGAILGKPRDRAQGLAMLQQLSGHTHQVFSGVALVTAGDQAAAVSVSTVTMRAIGAAEAIAYWQSGEPADKAGGYAIQGRGAVFVERLEGSYSGVMGLPLFETAALLRRFGIPLY